MMKKFVLPLLLLSCFMTSIALADFYSDVEQIKKFNPDGNKYEFVKDYLTSLSYLKPKANINPPGTDVNVEKKEDADKARLMMARIAQESTDVRVAKNMMRRYATSPNGLMLKAVNMFTAVCDEQILLNAKERELYQMLSAAQSKKKMASFDKNKFKSRREKLTAERHVSYGKLLETSMMVQKILVSNVPDRFGELVNLGITGSQRDKLLLKIKELFPDVKNEKIEAGQSFIEASVVAVKERLLDATWGTIP